jgi:hypothetical protein
MVQGNITAMIAVSSQAPVHLVLVLNSTLCLGGHMFVIDNERVAVYLATNGATSLILTPADEIKAKDSAVAIINALMTTAYAGQRMFEWDKLYRVKKRLVARQEMLDKVYFSGAEPTKEYLAEYGHLNSEPEEPNWCQCKWCNPKEEPVNE